ncbi:PREDICTED: kita-kyushu lung cancer antigen 1 [Myotis davidii]|uniref:Kita-kyushu lung cancer antigen 1 like protein n=1 Tax=Myotis davidii TaxID=225400 RepID=L5MJW6_MYODS|nr:PREDICTED: kita-kyushu lung cancer antigen 1 [Myotis davidii]ELK38671.1 Kita-kyushu lung cancer antigen 1 like protein [Myotis davidii]
MCILLLLIGGMLFAYVFLFWKDRLQRNHQMSSSDSTVFVLVRSSSSTWSTKRNTVNSLTISNLSQDALINFPQSVVIQKLILVNLGMAEYNMLELEHFLVTEDVNGALFDLNSTGMCIECIDYEVNH